MPFVNRFVERAKMDVLAADVRSGTTERHLALVGPRRIGKSRLLSDFRGRTAPGKDLVAVEVAIDQASATPSSYLTVMVRGVVNAFSWRAGRAGLGEAGTPMDFVAEATAISPDLGAVVTAALRLRDLARPDNEQLFTVATRLPEQAARATGVPVIVLADEFQHIVDLATYPPFRRGRGPVSPADRERVLKVLRPAIERREHVGWIVTGSSVRLMLEILGKGPLMGRFDVIEVGPFDSADARRLSRAIWEERGTEFVEEAADRVDTLTSGHPFYVDVVSRQAANYATTLGSPVTPDLIDRSLLEAVSIPTQSIYVACQEMWDSLVGRLPALRGLIIELAQRREASTSDLARAIGLPHEQNAWAHIRDLERVGLVKRQGSLVSLVDPIFAFWLVRLSNPEAPTDIADAGRAVRAIKRFEERYLADRADRGPIVEGHVRDLIRNFDGQPVPGKRFATAGTVRLPNGSNVKRIMAEDPGGDVFGYPATVELDACFGEEEVWLCEVKDRSRKSDAADISLLMRKDDFLRRVHGLSPGRTWFVSFAGFTTGARERAAEGDVLLSTGADLEAISSLVGVRRPAAMGT